MTMLSTDSSRTALVVGQGSSGDLSRGSSEESNSHGNRLGIGIGGGGGGHEDVHDDGEEEGEGSSDSDSDSGSDDPNAIGRQLTTLRIPPGCTHLPPMYVCATCGCHLALQDEVISKAFTGRHGQAFLFHSAINVRVGTPEDRRLLTGMHTVADVSCLGCDEVLGWTYLKAFEGNQKYKEGRFILEQEAIHKVNNWS